MPALARSLGAGGTRLARRNAAIAALVLLPGALCIGATFPFAVRWLARDRAGASRRERARLRLEHRRRDRRRDRRRLLAAARARLRGHARLRRRPEPRARGGLRRARASGRRAAWSRRRSPACSRSPSSARRTPWRLLRASPLSRTVAPRARWRIFGVGRSASVLLLDEGRGFRLTSNGLPEASISRADLERPGLHLETRWLGLLPVLANPDARSLLMVGLGGAQGARGGAVDGRVDRRDRARAGGGAREPGGRRAARRRPAGGSARADLS